MCIDPATFWFFGSVFIFILAANWIGLVPGVGSMGWGQQTAGGFRLEEPFFRGANADVNLTLAMALVFFACWSVWGIQEVGPLGFVKELFAPKGESTGPLKILLIVVFFAAGCLEVISILFRPVSLSFRLYGNIFAARRCWKRWRGCRRSAGSFRFRSTSWSCWSASCRRWYSRC